MAQKYSNETASIIANAYLEAAYIYSESLKEAAEHLAELVRLAQSVEIPEGVESSKPIIPEVKPEVPETKPLSSAVTLIRMRDELAVKQNKLKKERNFRKLNGRSSYATESETQAAVERNRKELRIMNAAIGRVRGYSFNTLESNWRNEKYHPLYKYLDEINKYLAEYTNSLPIAYPDGYKEYLAATKSAAKPAVKPSKPTAKPEAGQSARPSSYGIRVTNINERKLELIKVIKESMSLGLKEAKEISNKAPVLYENGLSESVATKLHADLIKAGFDASIIEA